MAIEFNVNGSIKSAKDVFVGVNSAKRKVIKIVTSMNGERKLLYGEDEPYIYTGYYFIDDSNGSKDQIIKTQDFNSFETIISSNNEFHSIMHIDGDVYAWDKCYKEEYKTVVLDKLYKINANGDITSSTCVFQDFSHVNAIQDAIVSEIRYYDGIFYVICRYFPNSGASGGAYGYMLFSSTDGIDWQQVKSVYASPYEATAYLLGCVYNNGERAIIYTLAQTSSRKIMSLRINDLYEKTLVSGRASYPNYSMAINISDSELIVRPTGTDTYTSYKITNNNGTVTSETNPANIGTMFLMYDGEHYYGAANNSKQDSKSLYFDTTKMYNALGNTFYNMCLVDNGVLIFDIRNNRYWLDSNGNVTPLGTSEKKPVTIYTSYNSMIYIPEE